MPRDRRRSEIRNDSQAVGAGGHDAVRSLRRQAADRHQRQRPDFPAPFFNTVKTLRRPRHGFELSLVNRPEGHVFRVNGKRRRQFLLIVS